METQELLIFISDHCFSCKESLEVAEQIRLRYPHVHVRIWNVDVDQPRLDIFAVPTYALNGKIVFLGNPTDEQIDNLLSKAN